MYKIYCILYVTDVTFLYKRPPNTDEFHPMFTFERGILSGPTLEVETVIMAVPNISPEILLHTFIGKCIYYYNNVIILTHIFIW